MYKTLEAELVGWNCCQPKCCRSEGPGPMPEPAQHGFHLPEARSPMRCGDCPYSLGNAGSPIGLHQRVGPRTPGCCWPRPYLSRLSPSQPPTGPLLASVNSGPHCSLSAFALGCYLSTKVPCKLSRSGSPTQLLYVGRWRETLPLSELFTQNVCFRGPTAHPRGPMGLAVAA